MIAKILLLCGTIELVQSDVRSRYPHGHKPWAQDHRMPTNPQRSSLPEEHWEREVGSEETPSQASVTAIERDNYDAGYHPSRNGNWCSSVRSRLVTYTAVCQTEKYIIKSQQPCPNGTPDCQKIMYRAALKPVYQVKQKVVSSLYWKCCPGYIGKDCEHHEPNFLPASADQLGSWEEDRETFSSQTGEIIETQQRHEALLEDLQNDIHQAASHLGALQKAFHPNVSSTRGEASHNDSNQRAVWAAKSAGQEQFLQQMLFPHVENFLRLHFHPVWASFNKSLQDLSIALKNLSQNVEANRRNIESFQESTVPKKDFQELGTKFESKIQDNVLKVEQMKREIESHFHQQQAAIHYNLTMIKADIDNKLKRNHKIQHMSFSALNHSIIDMRQEQNKLQGELEVLSRNLVFPVQLGSQNEPFADIDVQVLNQTLTEHAEQLKELYKESEEDYQELTRSISNLKVNLRQNIEEFRVDLIEKDLILEEYREDMERKILVLNDTLANIEQGHWDLQRSLKACHCENLPLGNKEDQMNISQINREEIKQLEARLKDLAAAFPLIHHSIDFQQEQSRKLEGSMSLLKFHTETLSENIGTLKENDERMHGHIKYLNSSFNSLLMDAMRHEKALVAVLGDEIMDALSEDDSGTFFSPPNHQQVLDIRLILDHLKKQNVTLESLRDRIHSLEMEHENDSSAGKSTKQPVPEKEAEDIVQEVNSEHDRVKHMEPNHEAAMEDALDNPAYHDIMTLKKEIEHISKEMKKYESQWNHTSFCCNHTRVNFMEPLTISVENLREDLATTQQSFEEHLQIFQKLFGSNKELAAANISLDVAKIQSLVGRRMRKQLKVQDHQKIRDKKETNVRREGTLNGRNKIYLENMETGTAVAFYVRYPEDGASMSYLNGTYLNYGGGFYPEHGYFKSPQSGIYMIAISMELPPGPALGQLVFSNGHRMTLMSYKKIKANGGPMTIFALVELKKGEHMSFELVQGASVKQEPAGLSMAGFLIFKT
ncbi:multimerin-2 isoform X3 [Pogona vitticeps]